jgi:cysteine-rich repeat protein
VIRFSLLFLVGCTSVVSFDTPRESGEQCGDGVDNDDNGAMDCEDPGCAGTLGCLGCGDGTVDVGEECDDRNTLPNDGCSPSCTVEICGDGETNPGEDCDDGNTDDTDACLTGCIAATCGDGHLQAGAEECDDQNAAADDGCTAGCVIERCGDGIPQSGPTIISAEFLWLATTCAPSGNISFRINGVTAMQRIGDPAESCNCAPPAGFSTAFGETPQMIDGFNTFEIDFAGTDHFLAWAVVLLHTSAGDREIVLYEGTPGAAAARTTSMCAGGFDENVPVTTRQVPVSIFEECDDGNQNDEDACRNDCRAGSPP